MIVAIFFPFEVASSREIVHSRAYVRVVFIAFVAWLASFLSEKSEGLYVPTGHNRVLDLLFVAIKCSYIRKLATKIFVTLGRDYMSEAWRAKWKDHMLLNTFIKTCRPLHSEKTSLSCSWIERAHRHISSFDAIK